MLQKGCQQFRAPRRGERKGLKKLPSPDFSMISGHKNVRNFHAAVLPWSRILRVFQQSGCEGLVLVGFLAAKYLGKQPCYAIDQYHSGKLPTGQDVIADGDFLDLPVIKDPLVDAFVVPTKEHQFRFR
jgi:hypothetical protein